MINRILQLEFLISVYRLQETRVRMRKFFDGLYISFRTVCLVIMLANVKIKQFDYNHLIAF